MFGTKRTKSFFNIYLTYVLQKKISLFATEKFISLFCSMDLREQLKNLFPEHEEQDFEMPEEKSAQKEPLICKFEKKGRNGKPVTLIEGFEGSDDELKKISKKIKITLGIGGSEKDGIIVIQGDNRDKIMKILNEMGYKTKRVGG